MDSKGGFMEEKYKEIFIKFGKNIKEFRQERNITLQELSELTGIRQQYLKKIEDGKAYRISSTHVFVFAKAFKIKPHEVLKGL